MVDTESQQKAEAKQKAWQKKFDEKWKKKFKKMQEHHEAKLKRMAEITEEYRKGVRGRPGSPGASAF